MIAIWRIGTKHSLDLFPNLKALGSNCFVHGVNTLVESLEAVNTLMPALRLSLRTTPA